MEAGSGAARSGADRRLQLLSPCDPGRSSAIQMSGSRSEVGGRLGTTARAGMERWRDRLALVTGASGGIGAAVARALVQQGLKVVGCARTVGNIEELAAECKSAGYPGTLIPHRCDLSSEEDILSMFSAVRSQHSGVDICINNAGLARPDTLLSGSTSGWKDMFSMGPSWRHPIALPGLQVNVLALSICTREAYRSMKERKVDDGHIININSATKYAVTALTEGLRQELREAQTHIRATCISPEVVETQFAFKLHDKDPEKAAATYECIKCLKPEDVAEAVIYVLSTPPHVQVSLALTAHPLEEASHPQRRTAGRPQGVGTTSWPPQALCLPADWRYPDEAHGAGDLVSCGELGLPSPPLAAWLLPLDFRC
ncbi:dehydrogenase/reductase SDR family member 11 isoform X3 [Leptonychotes weddellii]|uniref:Dehydrogenase/reductase SDR family member 11 n=1 Tax=Leptonychotes weddellii TaxID=9713 RepID=A0A7F8Q1A7_LEPWE|nr:dehydrogenase/reductase SDR family member 11 isoform X3 [Leptonychotes weddellii]